MIKILLLNDIHHGDTKGSTTHPGETRQANSQALQVLAGYIDTFNSRKYDVVINLGDAIRDVKDKESDLNLLDESMKVFSKIQGNKYFIAGNHELKTLDDDDIRAISDKHNVTSSIPCMLELGSFQILLIDSEIEENGLARISERTTNWIENTIDKTKPVMIFSHYSSLPLDGYANFYFEKDPKYMSYINGSDIARILSRSPKVVSVNAHTHMGSYKKLSNIDAISALAFSENIGAMQYPDANPGVYSEIWVDGNSVYFKSYSGKYCFLSMEL